MDTNISKQHRNAGNSTFAGNTTYRKENNFQSPRIMIAEDNITNQLVIERMLGKLGCCVDIAINGLDVLDKFQEVTYDLILMDCQMPEMDGFEATRRIRDSEENRAHIPIIALTASTSFENRKRCFAAGMDDFIAKPVQLAILRAKLQPWLKK